MRVRQGHRRSHNFTQHVSVEALTLGKAMAGLTAQSKGQRLGIFMKPEKSAAEARKQKHGDRFLIPPLGRGVPAIRTEDGVRAVNKGKPESPEAVERYLDSKFGDDLSRVRDAMQTLAKSMPRKDLAAKAFDLYAEFRPKIPDGVKGWGVKRSLDPDVIRGLAK